MFNALKSLFAGKATPSCELKNGDTLYIADRMDFKTSVEVRVVLEDIATPLVVVSNPAAVSLTRDKGFNVVRTKDVPLSITIRMAICPKLLSFYGNLKVKIAANNAQLPCKYLRLNASDAQVEITSSSPIVSTTLHLSRHAHVSLGEAGDLGYHQVEAKVNDKSVLKVLGAVEGLKVDMYDETVLDLRDAGTIKAKVIHDYNNRSTTVLEKA